MQNRLKVTVPGLNAGPSDLALVCEDDAEALIQMTNTDGQVMVVRFDRFELEEWLRQAGAALRAY